MENFSREEQAKIAAQRILATPISERLGRAEELGLSDSWTLLALCHQLDERMEAAPADVGEEAQFFYHFLEKLPVSKGFLFDEREYYFGKFACIAGSACRFLSLFRPAVGWFDRAEAWYLLTANSAGNLADLAYQRLAVKFEQRRFGEVLRLLPAVTQGFERSGARQGALKGRFLEGLVLMEMGRPREAVEVFRKICEEAGSLGSERLLAMASNNLVQLHAALGEAEEALRRAREAAPLLRRLNNRVGLAKLQWGIGSLFRSQGQDKCDEGKRSEGEGKLACAIEAYREAQTEFKEMGMRWDIAALHLVLADVLLELGQAPQARWEIQAALPIIDEEKMVSESTAALTLLRESLEADQIDRKALRHLHGYFEDLYL